MDTLHITEYFVASLLAFIGRQSEQAWLVGGFVRDMLLGRPIHDIDLAVPEGGIELARAISRAFGGAFFVLDRERDVARAIVTAPDGSSLDVDVARLRAPELLGDLALRDFTINAMAARVPPIAALPGATIAVIDPYDGQGDLARRLVRVVGSQAFLDDPLRTLRAVRQAVEFGFHLADETCALAQRAGHLLVNVSVERIRDELLRILAAPGAWQHVRLLASLNLLGPVLPELQALAGITQSAPHYLDVFDHTRAVMAHAEGILALLWPAGPYVVPGVVAKISDEPDPTPRPSPHEEIGPPQSPPLVGGARAPSPGGDVDSLPSIVDAGSPSHVGLPASRIAGEGLEERPAPDPCLWPLDADPIVLAPDWQWAGLAALLASYAEELRAHLAQPLAAAHSRRDLLLWAAMAHDWGKALTRTVGTDYRVHFYDHEQQGASLAENRLRLLTLATNEASYVGRLVDLHMRPAHLARHSPPSRRALYRFFRDAGEFGPDVALLALADKMSTRGPQAGLDRDFWADLLAVAGQTFEAYFRAHAALVCPVPLLDGRRIMAELALPGGPQVGRLIEALREAQAVGEVTTVEEARGGYIIRAMVDDERAWLHNQSHG